MTDLAAKQCVPCRGGVPPLKGGELERLLREIDQGWRVIGEHHLERDYRFKNFREALDFTIRIGELAEAQGHHPARQRPVAGTGPGQARLPRHPSARCLYPSSSAAPR